MSSSTTTAQTGDGVSITVHVDGPADAPPVVLLHGVILSAASWAWLVELLSDRYRLLRVDLRGHGHSERAPGRYDLPGFVEDAVAVCREVAGRPAFVVGHSLGGVIAATLAQQRPELVSGLLLEDPALLTALPVEPDAQPQAGPLIDLFRVLRRSIPHVQAAGLDERTYAATLRDVPTPFGVPVHERYHDDTPAAWAHSQLRFDVEVLGRFLEPGPDNLGVGLDLDRPFGAPTTVLAASHDAPNRVVSRSIEARIVAADPTLRVRRIAGAGHNMHDERGGRETFTEQLVATLREHHPA